MSTSPADADFKQFPAGWARHTVGVAAAALLGLLLVAAPLAAVSAADSAVSDKRIEAQPVLNLSSPEQTRYLGGYWSLLRDPSAKLSLRDVRSANNAGRFVAQQDDGLSLGFTLETVWLNFRVRNLNPRVDDWLLEIDDPLLDHIEVHACRPDTQAAAVCTSVVTGDHLPYSERPLPHRTFLLPMVFSGEQIVDYYVRIQTSSSLQVRLAVHSTTNLFHCESRDNIVFGLVYGFMLLMALYNGFLFMAVRDPAYLAYVFAVLSGTLFIMTINGHAAQYLWSDNPAWANAVAPLSASAWVFFTLIFTQLFLNTRQYTTRGWHAINALMVLALGGMATALLTSYFVAVQISTALGLMVGGLVLTVSVLCWRRGNRSARYFTIAWLAYGAGTSLLILNRIGLLGNTFLTHHSATMGLVAEIIILSLAMSDKYRLMREQMVDYSRHLEVKVQERTAELEAANEQLREMAQRDGLTRLANRRMFDSSLGSEWERHRRDGKHMALLLIDVDQFKQLNDHYGHRRGDQCLQALAQAMATALRRPADLAARYGGDEFAVILPETDIAGAVVVAERISEMVRELAIEQAPEADSAQVTLSIGVASLIPRRGKPAALLIDAADKALYQAKARGRDQLAVSPPDLAIPPVPA